MRSLQQVLTNDFGLDLTGWKLGIAWAVSDDGKTIVGSGTNPDGLTEAWIANLSDSNPTSTPEPTTVIALLVGLAGITLKPKA